MSNPDQIIGEYKLKDHEEDSNSLQQSAGSTRANIYIAIVSFYDDAIYAYAVTHSF